MKDLPTNALCRPGVLVKYAFVQLLAASERGLKSTLDGIKEPGPATGVLRGLIRTKHHAFQLAVLEPALALAVQLAKENGTGIGSGRRQIADKTFRDALRPPERRDRAAFLKHARIRFIDGKDMGQIFQPL